MAAEDGQKMGERLAWYTASKDILYKLYKLIKSPTPEIANCLQFTNDVVAGRKTLQTIISTKIYVGIFFR